MHQNREEPLFNMINFAVIGLGFAGEIHAKNISDIKNIKLAAVSDININKINNYKKQGVLTYLDWKELLLNSHIDAIVIATPHNSHLEIVREALKQGKHVLLEKPLGKDDKQAAEIIRLAKTTQKIVAVNITHCFYRPIIALKDFIQSGKLGQIIKIEDTMIFTLKKQSRDRWYFQKKLAGGGVTLTNGIHMLARIQYLFDLPLKFVSGQAYNLYQWGDVEDTMQMQLMLGKKIPVILFASWPLCSNEPKYIEELKIYGSRGIVKLNAWEGYEFCSYNNEKTYYKPYNNSTIEQRINLGMNDVLKSFILQIQHKQKKIKMIERVLHAQQIINAFYNSL